MGDISFVKGTLFEDKIQKKIMQTLEGTEYRIIKHFYTYSYDLRRCTELDLIVLTPRCIYVIEAKSFRTSITGNYLDKIWEGRSGKFVKKIVSPFLQNNIHMHALKDFFRECGFIKIPMKSIICFSDKCTINSNCSNTYHMSTFLQELVKDINEKSSIINVEKFHSLLEK